mmetsp:Transcript_127134/g.220374  ORF Transcript_127134/g.220374 Transcript_127134/m.220374 type:complete len:624 (-) Transcript_127134:265-2136(-)
MTSTNSRSVDATPPTFQPRAEPKSKGHLARWIAQRIHAKKKLEQRPQEEVEGQLFQEINNLRKPDMGDIDERGRLVKQDSKEKLYKDNIFGWIAGHRIFEATTLSLIFLNAVAIGHDVEWQATHHVESNLYDGPVRFIIIENFFCTYFSFEVVIRFLAYKRCIDCVKDLSFLFDAVLVLFMVAETWILPFLNSGGALAQLSILRLLRLLRITRMARLMRAVPEIMIIVKGIVAAARTVVCTGALLTVILYTFAIFFTNEFHQGDVEDEEAGEIPSQYFFGSMGKSMFTLFILGTILDDITQATNAIRTVEKPPWFRLLAFLIFVLLASMMLLNMLVGVLVEVVSATSEAEREKAIEMNVREAIADLFDHLDKDENNKISQKEFKTMKNSPNVMKALEELDIHQQHFDIYCELFFRPEVEGGPMPWLSYDNLMDMIMRLRPGSFVSALDFAAFSKHIFLSQERIKQRVAVIEQMCDSLALRLCGEIPDDKDAWATLCEPGPVGDDALEEVGLLGMKARVAAPESSGHSDAPPSYRKRLDRMASADLIEELQRRLGMADLGQTGVPFSMMDEELQTRVREAIPHASAQAFMTLGVPQDEVMSAININTVPTSPVTINAWQETGDR